MTRLVAGVRAVCRPRYVTASKRARSAQGQAERTHAFPPPVSNRRKQPRRAPRLAREPRHEAERSRHHDDVLGNNAGIPDALPPCRPANQEPPTRCDAAAKQHVTPPVFLRDKRTKKSFIYTFNFNLGPASCLVTS